MAKEYDYLLKVLLVGDSDVGKTEILNNFEVEDNEGELMKTKVLKKVKSKIKNKLYLSMQPHTKQKSFY